MTNCWYCGNQMIWNSDFSFEDCGLECEGIVTVLSCPNCQAVAEFYHETKDEDILKIN